MLDQIIHDPMIMGAIVTLLSGGGLHHMIKEVKEERPERPKPDYNYIHQMEVEEGIPQSDYRALGIPDLLNPEDQKRVEAEQRRQEALDKKTLGQYDKQLTRKAKSERLQAVIDENN